MGRAPRAACRLCGRRGPTAAAGGIGIAWALTRLVVSISLPIPIPLSFALQIDGRVLLFTAGSVLCASKMMFDAGNGIACINCARFAYACGCGAAAAAGAAGRVAAVSSPPTARVVVSAGGGTGADGCND